MSSPDLKSKRVRFEGAAEETPLLKKQPCVDAADLPVGSISVLVDQFGSKLLIMLFVVQHLVKGFAREFTSRPQRFLYADYGVPAPQMQIYDGVVALPWAFKPAIGLLSDALPICGLKKMPYMIIATVLGLASCVVVGFLPQGLLNATQLVVCFVLMSLMYSTTDLLTEAKYAEKMQMRPKHGPALMSFVWGGLNLAALVATVFVGPVLVVWGNQLPFALAIIPISCMIGPLLLNYLEETANGTEEQTASRGRLFAQFELIVLCLLMLVGTILVAIVGIVFQSVHLNACVALAVASVLLVSFSVLLRPVVAKVNAFFLLQRSLGLSVAGAAFYFYTDGPQEYPEGPHFSTTFYATGLGTVSLLFSLLGIYTYERYLSKWSYRSLLIMVNIVLVFAHLGDVVLFSRLNTSIGLPDHILVIGASALDGVLDQWMFMPGIVIVSRLCPPGMEATMYALLAGCHNFGSTINSHCGALLLHALGCAPNGAPGESAQFEYLWLASLISAVLPALTVLLTPFLIPGGSQIEDLLPEGDRDATTGSLYRRWQELL